MQLQLPDSEEEYLPSHFGEKVHLTQEEIDSLLEIWFADPEEFCKDVLPNMFTKKMPWVHKGLLAIITGRVDWLVTKCTQKELDKIIRHFSFRVDPDDEKSELHFIFTASYDVQGNIIRLDMAKGRFTEVIMPRGFSKTTLIGLAGMLYKILFKENKFLVYISETVSAAEKQLGNVKSELSGNELIQMCFGNLKPQRDGELKWTQNMIETTNGVIAIARGRGSQVRGLNIRGQRPDCVLFDDVEDKESVKTTEQREKTREWFYGDVIPCLPSMDENATIIGLGTVLHSEALLLVLARDPDWTTVIFGAIDKDGEPLWEDNMSLEKLENKKRSYTLAGMLHLYYMEYESKIRSEEGSLFKGTMFILRPEWRGELDCISQVIDPAISEEVGADFCALAVAGITTRGYFLLLDMWLKKGAHPNEQIDIFFEKSKQWDVQKHGVEAVAYQKALVHLIRGEMFRRKRYFVVEEIRHGKTAKDERIKGILHPRYHGGHIAHYRRFPEYESQLLDFPNGKKDGPDAFAMAITLLDPYAANMADPDSNDLEKDEYEPIGKWRQY